MIETVSFETTNKLALLKYIHSKCNNTESEKASYVLYEFDVSIDVIDKETINVLSELYCSITIHVDSNLCCTASGLEALKKAFTRKCMLLNDAGLVFGFYIDCAEIQEKSKQKGNTSSFSLKTFRDFFNFLVFQYPNHIIISAESLKPSAVLSTQDITALKRFELAVSAFYTAGRAVPWFLSVLKPLRLRPAVFISDFIEWQECNNCGLSSNFDPDNTEHKELEKMQLVFLKQKYEEKHLWELFPLVEDVVRLNGAFARAVLEKEETTVDMSFTPDDVFSPAAQDIKAFIDETCMEACSVCVYSGPDGPEYRFV